MFLTLSND